MERAIKESDGGLGSCQSLARMVNLGREGGNRSKERFFDNISSFACDPPILRCVANTHKPVGDNGVPKSRPIVGVSNGLTMEIKKLLSDILEPLARIHENSTEEHSTEELFSKVRGAN